MSVAYTWTAGEEALAKAIVDDEAEELILQQAFDRGQKRCREYKKEVEELKKRVKTLEEELAKKC